MESDIFQRVEKLLSGKTAEGGPDNLKAGAKITKSYLDDIGKGKWFEVRLKNEEANQQLELASKQLDDLRKEFDQRLDEKRNKITAGDDLGYFDKTVRVNHLF